MTCNSHFCNHFSFTLSHMYYMYIHSSYLLLMMTHTHTHNIVVFCCVYALLYGICSSRTEHWHCWESDLVSEREKNWLSSQFSIFSPPFDDNRSLTRLNLAMNTSFSAPVWKGMSLKNWRLRKTLATSSLGGHHKNTITKLMLYKHMHGVADVKNLKGGASRPIE